MDTEINVGDRVRSYDFPEREDCYVEGVVEEIGRFERFPDCPRYKIRVDRTHWDGRDMESALRHVYPPVNGTPTMGERVCNGVRKL